MLDNPKEKRKSDKQRININQEYEVWHWTNKLACTKLQLEKAVKAVGPGVKDIEAWLDKKNEG